MPKKTEIKTSSVWGGVDKDTGKTKTFKYKYSTQAEKKEEKRKAEKRAELWRQSKDACDFASWADKWFDRKIELDGISTGTINEYKPQIKAMKEAFGDKLVTEIVVNDMQELIDSMAKKNPYTGKPSSAKTLQAYTKTFCAIMKYARKSVSNVHFIDVSDISIPRTAGGKVNRALREEEIYRVLEMEHYGRPFLITMMLTGVREGEIVPLLWSDVDFEKRVLTVNKSVDNQKNQSIVKEGTKTTNKTGVSEKKIPLCPYMIDMLSEMKKGKKDSDLIFEKKTGGLHTHSSIRNLWESYLDDMNIIYGYPDHSYKSLKYSPNKPPFVIYKFCANELRHTFATLMCLQGVPFQQAIGYMGHSDSKMLNKVYTDYSIIRNELSDEFKQRLETDFKISE